MAKQIKKRQRNIKKKFESPFNNYWKSPNYILFGTGFGILILGFFLMTFGPWDNPVSLTISPLVLLVAYLVVFPVSILYKKKKTTETNTDVPGKN